MSRATDYANIERKAWVENIIADCVIEGMLDSDKAYEMTDEEKDKYAEFIAGRDYPESEPY